MQENILIREQINNLFSHIDNIPKSRKYWLIRTESGRFYDDFIKGNYFIEFVLDDRHQVVDTWRKDLKLPCFQVYYGNF